MTSIQNIIHEKAQLAASIFLKSEAALLNVIDEVDQHKVFRAMECSSLIQYCIQKLKLPEHVAYNCITVMRKSREVPALKGCIQKGDFSVSKGRKITSVLTPENQADWLEKAKKLPQKKLEHEVAKANPKAATPERAKYVSDKRLDLRLGVSEKLMLKLRRAQDLHSQSTRRAASLEDTLGLLVEFYLERKDPVRKAKRAIAKKGFQSNEPHMKSNGKTILEKTSTLNCNKTVGNTGAVKNARYSQPLKKKTEEVKLVARRVGHKIGSLYGRVSLREPISAAIKHEVTLRDKGRCRYEDKNALRCLQRRWLDVHHLKPVSEGGGNRVKNLILICNSHHHMLHEEPVLLKRFADRMKLEI